MLVTMLLHTLPRDRDDYGLVFARPSKLRDCDDDNGSLFERPSKPRDCTCNALSPNTLH